jgi:hypothetical protein
MPISPAPVRRCIAVAGGIKNGGFWGHLEYIDHGDGHPKVHGTGVNAFTVTGPTSRHIEGTANIDGTPGTYMGMSPTTASPAGTSTHSV